MGQCERRDQSAAVPPTWLAQLATWGEKLTSEFEAYQSASKENRLKLFLSWNKEERRRVYLYSSTAHREEQNQWKEHYLPEELSQRYRYHHRAATTT